MRARGKLAERQRDLDVVLLKRLGDARQFPAEDGRWLDGLARAQRRAKRRDRRRTQCRLKLRPHARDGREQQMRRDGWFALRIRLEAALDDGGAMLGATRRRLAGHQHRQRERNRGANNHGHRARNRPSHCVIRGVPRNGLPRNHTRHHARHHARHRHRSLARTDDRKRAHAESFRRRSGKTDSIGRRGADLDDARRAATRGERRLGTSG